MASRIWVEAILDEEALANGWDGDLPLDATKTWTPYILVLCRDANSDGSSELIDSIGSVWASDDDEGQQHIEDTIDHQLLDDSDKSLPPICDLEIIFI